MSPDGGHRPAWKPWTRSFPMTKHNRRGRSKGGGRFVQLYHSTMQTAAWRALRPAAVVVYLDLRSLYDGRNNGSLLLSCRQAADRTGIDKDTAARALAQLTALGFVEVAEPGGFVRKVRHATTWRLTDLRCDRTGAAPTNGFQRWRPESPEQFTVPKVRRDGPQKPDTLAGSRLVSGRSVPTARTDETP